MAVVKKNGRVAIAADSLASFGTRKLSIRYNKRAGKIFRIGTSWVGLTGWSVHQQVLEHLFRSVETPPRFTSADEIFDAFLKLHPRLKQEYFMNPGDRDSDAYESSQMTLLIADGCGAPIESYAVPLLTASSNELNLLLQV